MFLFLSFRVAVITVNVPTVVSPQITQNVWLAPLIVVLMTMIIGIIVIKLAGIFPGLTIIQYSTNVVGNIAGKLVGLIYIFWFLHIAAIELRQFGEFMIISFMPETPLVVFLMIMVIMSVYAARNGLEVISRANDILFLFIISVIYCGIALAIPQMSPKFLIPITEGGLKSVFTGSLTPFGWFGEIAFLTMVIPSINKPKEAIRVVVLGSIIGGLHLLVMTTGVITTFGIALVKNLTYPGLMMLKMISDGRFIEHVEAIIAFAWISGIFIEITFFFYLSVVALSQWLNIKNPNPLFSPMGVILVVTAVLLADNIIELRAFFQPFLFGPYMLSIELFIPIGLLLIAYLRHYLSSKNAF